MPVSLLSLPQLSYLSVWLPEEVKRNTLWVPKDPRFLAIDEDDDPEHPFVAVSRCPKCKEVVLLRRLQCLGIRPMICQSGRCSYEYFIIWCEEKSDAGREFRIKTQPRSPQ